MEKVEESMEVIVREQEESKEIKFELYTMNNPSANVSYFCKGKLNALILRINKACNIRITSELGYNVYEEKNAVGDLYIPLKITAVSRTAQQFNYVADNFYFNENLIFEVEGREAEVEFILRLE